MMRKKVERRRHDDGDYEGAAKELLLAFAAAGEKKGRPLQEGHS